MHIVDSILLASAVDQSADEQIGERELQNVAKPSVNRKILGRWAPITRRSTLLAVEGAKSVDQSLTRYGLTPRCTFDSTIMVPYTIEIFRSAGKKLGPKNHYGQFDAHLEQGEMLTVRAAGEAVYFLSKEVEAHADNEIVHLADEGSFGGYSLSFGGIVYLSDYLMIMKDVDDAVDVWLRC